MTNPETAENLAHLTAVRELRAGHHLHVKAREQGWLDNGEGAYEYVVRRAYECGQADALLAEIHRRNLDL